MRILLVIALLVIAPLAFAGAVASAVASEPQTCGGLTYAEWLRFNPERAAIASWPLWKRLLFSLRPWGETGTGTATWHWDSERGVAVKGAGTGIEFKVETPSSFAAGVQGKVEW